ncbi:Dual specificity protein phosphatase, partial [Globisporangium splendens]
MVAAEETSVPPPLYDRVAVIPGKLEYAATSQTTTTSPPTVSKTDSQGKELYVCIDDELVYARFFADFGPLNLAQTVRFCNDMHQKQRDFAAANDSDSPYATTSIVVYSSEHPHKRANAMTLLALYLVIVHKCTPEQAVARSQSVRSPFGFRDAAYGICTFFITMLDCARAVHKAIQSGIWSLETFSLSEYEYYDQLQHGDLNWIIPGKLIAFSGPQRERTALDVPGKPTATTLLAQDYAKVFQELGVTCVVRFNEPSTYDRKAFLYAGIQHLDLQYPDDGNPPDEILYKFLRRELFQLTPFDTITVEKEASESAGLRRKTKKKQNNVDAFGSSDQQRGSSAYSTAQRIVRDRDKQLLRHVSKRSRRSTSLAPLVQQSKPEHRQASRTSSFPTQTACSALKGR